MWGRHHDLLYCWVLVDLDLYSRNEEALRIINDIRSNLKGHSPTYLAGAGCVGVLTTAYLTARASFKAGNRIGYEESHNWDNRTTKERIRYYVPKVWKLYIPAGVSGVLTVGCILGANRLGSRRIIAGQVLLAASERAYSAYRGEVIEEYGERKDVAIRDKVAEKVVDVRPPPEVMIAGTGDVTCCEIFTGRYFSCTMERLKRAQNDLNAKLLRDDYCTLDEFYWILGLEYTQTSSEMGWRSDRLMELEFTTTIHKEKPVLVFGYNYVRQL